MTQFPQFCSYCGAQMQSGDQFCGACGQPMKNAGIISSPKKPPSIAGQTKTSPDRKKPHEKDAEVPVSSHYRASAPSLPAATKSSRQVSDQPRSEHKLASKDNTEGEQPEPFLTINLLASGFQWAVVWLIGWLPIGILISRFYSRLLAIHYFDDPLPWGATLPGAMTAFAVGAFIGGFIAGVMTHRVLKHKELSIGGWGIIPALIWALFWGALLIILTMDSIGMSEEEIALIMLILAPVFGPVTSLAATELIGRTSNCTVTGRKKALVALWWGILSIFGLLVAFYL